MMHHRVVPNSTVRNYIIIFKILKNLYDDNNGILSIMDLFYYLL